MDSNKTKIRNKMKYRLHKYSGREVMDELDRPVYIA